MPSHSYFTFLNSAITLNAWQMKSITVFNNKGGVGKTTLLCNLAAFLGRKRSKRVLIVDADPQCNATTYIFPNDTLIEIYENKKAGTIHDIFDPISKGKGYFQGPLPTRTSDAFGIDVLPGDPRLALQEDLLATDWQQALGGNPRGLQTTMIFAELLTRCKDYDFVFFDLGPSLGAINRAVLLGSDFFMIPMSSDIFSLQAIENISISLNKWKKGLLSGISAHNTSDEAFTIHNSPVEWKLKFLGYVTQQYTAKRVKGIRRAVKAYDQIIRRIPHTLKILAQFSAGQSPEDNSFELGTIPNLHSLIPLSQEAHVPFFALEGKHGVVGAHFVKVKEGERIVEVVANNVLAKIQQLS